VRTGQQSRTAEYMAFFRALETARPERRRQFADPLAAEFLGPPLRTVVRAARLPAVGALVRWVIDRRFPGPRPSAVVRTRLIDDAVAAAVGDGIHQLVVLGAGYDSRAYRLPGIERVRVFEVDHPATQTAKRRVVERVLGEEPLHVRFVPVNLDVESLDDVLTDAGLVAGRQSFFVVEGLVSYLTPAGADATLRWAGAVAGPGSGLAMTYVHRGLVDGTVNFPHSTAWRRSVEKEGEPFVSGFDPDELRGYLAERSWRLADDLSTVEALARQGMPRRRVPGFYRIAFATRAGFE
jgi:methyltransferase (TIGR00027 family)